MMSQCLSLPEAATELTNNEEESTDIMLEKYFTGCECRHSADEGPHLAQELTDGGFAFPNGDCQLIGRDGKMVMINLLQAAVMSKFLSIAFLTSRFVESNTREIKFPLFTSKEIADAFEMSNWIGYYWCENRMMPTSLPISLPCAFNLLKVASFFQMEYLLKVLTQFFVTEVSAEKLIQVYRLAQLTDAHLSERLWRRILTDFYSLYQNETFLSLTSSEMKQLFSDRRLNILKPQVAAILKSFNQKKFRVVSKDADQRKVFGTDKDIEAYELQSHSRIPYKVMLAHGGWSDGPTPKVEIYNYHQNKWSTLAVDSLEENNPRAYHGICVTDAGLLSIGGFNGRRYFRSTSFYDFNKGTWTPKCFLNEPRCYVSLSKLDNFQVIACGGNSGHSRLKTTEIYNFHKNQWSKAASMRFVRSDASAVKLDQSNKVYVVGGFDGRECHRSLEYYCIERDQWILERAAMTSRRSGIGAVALDANVIVAVGGFNGIRRLSSSEYLDTREGFWHQLSDLNVPRSNFGTICFEGEPIVIGGYNTDRTIPDVERLDFRTNKWTQMPSMNISRSAVACCVIENVDWLEKIFEWTA